MHPAEIRRRALLAAVKVSLSFAVFGCGAGADDGPGALTAAQSSSCGDTEARCGAGAAGVGAAGASAGGNAGSGVAAGGAGDAGAGKAGAVDMAGALGARRDDCGVNEASPVDASQVGCCKAMVSSQIVNWVAPARPSAELMLCCKALVATSDAGMATEGPGELWHVASSCCGLLGSPHGITCTPWGPPTPPAMELALLGELGWLGVA